MYCPTHFQESRPEVLLGLIEQFALASVVVQTDHGLVADHIPVFYQAQTGTAGKLVGHVAKSNPLWQCSEQQELLLIFQGPSLYISPNGYASKKENGKVVPTWNYAAVHVHATLKALPDPADILPILHHLTQQHEASQPTPWQVSDAPSEYTEKLLAHIVGVEFNIRRMQGKWKVSQNQTAQNQHSLMAALRAQNTDTAEQMAATIDRFRLP